MLCIPSPVVLCLVQLLLVTLEGLAGHTAYVMAGPANTIVQALNLLYLATLLAHLPKCPCCKDRYHQAGYGPANKRRTKLKTGDFSDCVGNKMHISFKYTK
jgi:hypothetical protein